MLGRAFDCAVFALWVSVCAAAPEFIWRGLVAFADHLTLQEVYSAVLIAMLLAFFVEPVMERIRTRRWQLEQPHAKTSVWAAIVALAFGIAAVCIHESMTAYLGGAQAADPDKQANLVKAIDQVQEWALIPFVVTITWFGARARGWAVFIGGGLAGAWVIAVGLYYGWLWQEIARTAIPCFAIIALGERVVSERWADETFLRLAFLTAAIAAAWFALAWLVQGSAWALGAPRFHIYSWGEFFEDVRFYLGWSLGLAVAPSPAPQAARGR